MTLRFFQAPISFDKFVFMSILDRLERENEATITVDTTAFRLSVIESVPSSNYLLTLVSTEALGEIRFPLVSANRAYSLKVTLIVSPSFDEAETHRASSKRI